MIVTLRQWAPIDSLYDQSLDHKLVGQTMPINISGRDIPATVVVAKVRPDGRELDVTLELPDHDPTVAAFARMVGTSVQHLGHGGAPQAYEALDDLIESREKTAVNSDAPNTEDLVQELITIGRAERMLVPPRGTEARERIMTIGTALYLAGGQDLMLAVHAKVAAAVGSDLARELEVAWDGIGDWRS